MKEYSCLKWRFCHIFTNSSVSIRNSENYQFSFIHTKKIYPSRKEKNLLGILSSIKLKSPTEKGIYWINLKSCEFSQTTLLCVTSVASGTLEDVNFSFLSISWHLTVNKDLTSKPQSSILH